jgi:hypothetical protein
MSKGNKMRILRGLSSESLPCGCVAGVYETYGGPIVTIIDGKGTRCSTSSHREGKFLTAESAPTASRVIGRPDPRSRPHD